MKKTTSQFNSMPLYITLVRYINKEILTKTLYPILHTKSG